MWELTARGAQEDDAPRPRARRGLGARERSRKRSPSLVKTREEPGIFLTVSIEPLPPLPRDLIGGPSFGLDDRVLSHLLNLENPGC